MSPEIALWILGSALLPIIGWGVHITWSLMMAKQDIAELLDMHKDPDKYGFGTQKTNELAMQLKERDSEMKECIRGNTRAVQSLTYYIKWLAEKQTGESVPPLIHENETR